MIKVKLNHPDAKLPVRANPLDAGADLFSVESVVINPGERAFIDTGISIALDENNLHDMYKDECYFRIAPRSGLAYKSGIDVLAGVVDLSYRGSVKVGLYNTGKEPLIVNVGDRIAQLIREICVFDDFVEVESLDETSRGSNGFGSTGVSSTVQSLVNVEDVCDYLESKNGEKIILKHLSNSKHSKLELFGETFTNKD